MNELPLNQILCGNCVEVLKDFPDHSIDLVVTDPPYGLSFMGKDWDKTLPPREAFEEIIRVLKPGALSFVMSSPRQDVLWRMLSMLEGVGFELTQSYIDWIYKTGFPKAYDVSKGIDKRFNKITIGLSNFQDYLNDKRKAMGFTLKEINVILNAPENSGLAGHKFSDKTQPQFLTREQFDVLKPILGIDEKYSKLYDELEREIIGAKTAGIGSGQTYAFTDRNIEAPKKIDITKPTSDLAKKWDGWKSQTGLKPAHEPILMVNKPFSESTIVDNVLRWGTGAINVDACRIPFQNENDKEGSKVGFTYFGARNALELSKHKDYPLTPRDNSKGRFPANLLVSDNAIDTGKITQTDTPNRIPKLTGKRDGSVSGDFGINSGVGSGNIYSDSGDQSRYFDLDAWAEHHGFLDVPKPDNSERDFGLKGKKRVPKSKFNLNDGSKDMRFDGIVPTPRRNVHPTVKPIKLMAYLIELGCPPNGVVLDPFVGSGTTCIAAKQLVRKFIGIEIDPKYHALAKARVDAYPIPLSWFSGSETEDVLVPPRGGKNES